METITLLADEYGYEVEALSEFGEDILDELDEEDDEEANVGRPPVVTIMGHVDHGKTTLTAAITKVQSMKGLSDFISYDEVAKASESAGRRDARPIQATSSRCIAAC